MKKKTLQLVGLKKGMTRQFDKEGRLLVCTMIQLKKNKVTQVKTVEKDGYSGIQMAGVEIRDSKKKNVTKPLQGHYAKAKCEPCKKMVETPLASVEEYSLGQEIGVDMFEVGSFVDVIGKTKGKGYQGVMKRHNFSGGPATHGSKFHRSAGSTGSLTPSRNFKNGKKAGHMGAERQTTECLLVVGVNVEKEYLLVKGAVPGPTGNIVCVRKALKKNN
ncbi:50S ribosomal protein L3 [Candidatus Aerophobetes bacterium]|uniref:Large ribosomal subunit protein uL3 n=1 Tax=Aerophobetes bacterium TaxID=2030807 RepID=A0A2A4X8J1_UNCAE|nr:MAG: 50S ribosomal protein L3 [Candidatus Aerophobetes bacterium]